MGIFKLVANSKIRRYYITIKRSSFFWKSEGMIVLGSHSHTAAISWSWIATITSAQASSLQFVMVTLACFSHLHYFSPPCRHLKLLSLEAALSGRFFVCFTFKGPRLNTKKVEMSFFIEVQNISTLVYPFTPKYRNKIAHSNVNILWKWARGRNKVAIW